LRVSGLEQVYASIENQSGSLVVTSVKGDVERIITRLTRFTERVEQARVDAIGREQRAEEEANARALFDTVQVEMKRMEMLRKDLANRSSQDIAAVLRDIRRQVTDLINDYGELSNRSGSDEVRALGDNLATMLESMEQFAGFVEQTLERARSLEAKREEEEQSAEALKQQVLSELQLMPSLKTAMAAKTASELESMLTGFMERKLRLTDAYGNLANTAGSDLVIAISVEIAAQITQLDQFGLELKSTFDHLREREKMLAKEEQQAEELSRLLEERNISSLKKEILSQKTVAQIEALTLDYNALFQAIREAYEGLTNRSNSPKVAAVLEPGRLEVARLTGYGETLHEALAERRAFEARRAQEEVFAQKLSVELNTMVSQTDKIMTAIENMSSLISIPCILSLLMLFTSLLFACFSILCMAVIKKPPVPHVGSKTISSGFNSIKSQKSSVI